MQVRIICQGAWTQPFSVNVKCYDVPSFNIQSTHTHLYFVLVRKLELVLVLHSKHPHPLVFEVLVRELGPVDGLAACAVASREVSTLQHEVLDHPVESGVLEAEAFLSSAQRPATTKEQKCVCMCVCVCVLHSALQQRMSKKKCQGGSQQEYCVQVKDCCAVDSGAISGTAALSAFAENMHSWRVQEARVCNDARVTLYRPMCGIVCTDTAHPLLLWMNRHHE